MFFSFVCPRKKWKQQKLVQFGKNASWWHLKWPIITYSVSFLFSIAFKKCEVNKEKRSMTCRPTYKAVNRFHFRSELRPGLRWASLRRSSRVTVADVAVVTWGVGYGRVPFPILQLWAQISDGRGRHPPNNVGIRKLEWLPLRVVSKHPHSII